jgi:hypothetical protein
MNAACDGPEGVRAPGPNSPTGPTKQNKPEPRVRVFFFLACRTRTYDSKKARFDSRASSPPHPTLSPWVEGSLFRNEDERRSAGWFLFQACIKAYDIQHMLIRKYFIKNIHTDILQKSHGIWVIPQTR